MAEFHNRTRRSASIPHKLLRLGRVAELPLYWILSTADLAREGFENSGSYRFADHIYRNEPSGRLGIGRWIDRLILNMRAVRSFRGRFVMAREELLQFLRERAERPLDILSAPCGIPRDLVQAWTKFLATGGEARGVSLHVLDLDEEVLSQARGFAAGSGVSLIAHYGDALDIGVYEAEFDFITSTGFGEFLDDEQLLLLYGIFHQILRPGGIMVTSAMRRLPLSDYLLRMAELRVHYRSAEDLARIARSAGFSILATRVDEYGIQSFLKATK